MPWWRQWLGFDRDDLDNWHVGIFFMTRKRKHHRRTNLWHIHSTLKNGVHIKQISPRHFAYEGISAIRRIEILHFDGIREEQKERIVSFANSKVGSVFDQSPWRYKMLPYTFGLPNVRHNQNQLSCQQLALAAYADAAIYFPHPYKSFPIFNIGKLLGRPLGHQRDRVDPRDPYLMDHHIYRDPRFVLKAIGYQDPKSGEFKLETDNIKKYSWNEALRQRYISKGYLDPQQ
jgi:hypothetical protein